VEACVSIIKTTCCASSLGRSISSYAVDHYLYRLTPSVPFIGLAVAKNEGTASREVRLPSYLYPRVECLSSRHFKLKSHFHGLYLSSLRGTSSDYVLSRIWKVKLVRTSNAMSTAQWRRKLYTIISSRDPGYFEDRGVGIS
jgi:hypothetical protein